MRSIWLTALLMLCLAAFAHDLMIYGPEGVHIYINGDFEGITDEEGMYFYNLQAGMYRIEAKKRTFDTWRRDMRLSDEGKTEVYVELVRPQKGDTQFGDSLYAGMPADGGSILVRSAPERCQVIFDGETYEKKRSSLLVEGIIPGKYWIRFNKSGYESLTTLLDIADGCLLRLDGDFIRGEIDIFTECTGLGDPNIQDPDPRGEKIIVVPQIVNLEALQGDSLIEISWKIYNGSGEPRHLSEAHSSAPYIVFRKDIAQDIPPSSAITVRANLYTREIEGYRGEFPVIFIIDGINITTTGYELVR